MHLHGGFYIGSAFPTSGGFPDLGAQCRAGGARGFGSRHMLRTAGLMLKTNRPPWWTVGNWGESGCSGRGWGGASGGGRACKCVRE